MPDRRITLPELEAALTNMGYSLLDERDGLRFYSDGSPARPIFLDVNDAATRGDVARQLEAHGINLDVFFNTLEAL